MGFFLLIFLLIFLGQLLFVQRCFIVLKKRSLSRLWFNLLPYWLVLAVKLLDLFIHLIKLAINHRIHLLKLVNYRFLREAAFLTLYSFKPRVIYLANVALLSILVIRLITVTWELFLLPHFHLFNNWAFPGNLRGIALL